jgi:hypothetical protein
LFPGIFSISGIFAAMKRLLTKYRLEATGVVLGTAAGLGYWYFSGCESGSCYITSDPLYSSLYGGFTGALLLGLFRKEKK